MVNQLHMHLVMNFHHPIHCSKQLPLFRQLIDAYDKKSFISFGSILGNNFDLPYIKLDARYHGDAHGDHQLEQVLADKISIEVSTIG